METRKFLVVVDPARRQHKGISWIVEIARQRRVEKMEINLFIGFETGDRGDPDAPTEVVKGPEWFEELVKPLRDAGLDYNMEVVWTTNWRLSVIDAVKRTGADIIMLAKSAAEHQAGLITDTKWRLVRDSPVPVAIIGRESSETVKLILAAVNMESKDSKSEELNEKVLLHGFELSGYYGAEFHVVNAYQGTEDFPNFSDVQRIVDVPRKNIHRDMGHPEDVISDVAVQLKADLVIIGSKARKGLRATLRGNTSEKVLEKLATDILVLN